MTTAGFLSMVFSLAFVVVLCSWCYYRVLTAPSPPAEPFDEFHSA